ncbi:MAG: tetratricopeptide repeat protein [Chloroflexota bacterium]
MSRDPHLEGDSPALRGLEIAGSVMLIVGLGLLIAVAWNSKPSEGYYAMYRAESLLSDGRYTGAQSLLERTLPIYNSPQLRLDLSYAYLARRDDVRAERQARIALAEAPPPLQAAGWAQLGRVLLFAGRDTEAMAALDEAQKRAALYPDDQAVVAQRRSALWHAAMVHWSRGEWQAAEQSLDELAHGSGIYAESARVKLAQLLAPEQADMALPAIDDLEDGISAGSPVPAMRVPGVVEGLSHEEMQAILSNLRLAQGEAARAAQSGASEAAVETIWGGSFLQQGENRLARQYLERAVLHQPDYAPAHSRLALALLNLAEPEAAFEHLQTAIRLDGLDALAHNVMARLYMQQRDWDRALEQLTILRRLEPSEVEVHLQWAEYYRLQGEYEQAENEYVDAANLQIAGVAASGGSNAPLILARFYTDVRGFGCEKGLPAARQSLALYPDDPASFDAVGWSLVLCKETQQAVSGLEGAVKLAPDVARYRLHLAKAYMELGRNDDAREQYGWVLDLDPGGPLERLAMSDLVKLPR